MSDFIRSGKLRGFDPQPLYEHQRGFNAGQGDLFVGADTEQALGRGAACMLRAGNEDGTPYFRGVTVILPPQAVWNIDDAGIHEMLVRAWNEYQGTPLTAEERDHLVALVRIHRCGHLRIDEVVQLVAGTRQHQLILIAECDKYRDDTDTPRLGRTSVLIAEDVWVPHVSRLAQRVLPLARDTGSFVIFNTEANPPGRPESRKMLSDVEELYPVFVAFAKTNLDKVVAEDLPRWVAMASSGRAVEAFAQLEAADIDSEYKAQIAIQLRFRSGERERAATLIREMLACKGELPAELAGRFGRIAYLAGDTQTAKSLIASAIDGISDQPLLEALLESSTSMRAAPLTERAWLRLRTLFPQSELLASDLEVRVMQRCQARLDDAEALPSNVGFEAVHEFLLASLSADHTDYFGMIRQAQAQFPDHVPLAAICGAIHAHSRQLPEAAIVLAAEVAEDERYEARAVRIILSGLRRMLLLEIRPEGGLETYKGPMLFVIRYLARHPGDMRARNEFASVLSVESAGSLGLPMLASFTLDVLSAGVQVADAHVEVQPVPEEQLKEFFKDALEWMERQPVVELGIARLPAAMVGKNGPDFMAAMNKLLRYASLNSGSAEDLRFLEKLAAVICALTPYAPDGAPDILALRLLANRLWLAGQQQRARDIAEQLLELAQGSPMRTRLAWCGYADIYHRANNLVDALIGIACALICAVPLDAGDLFQEAYTMLRVTRDLHLTDIARNLLASCRKLYALAEVGQAGDVRLDGIEIGLDFVGHDNAPLEQLERLLDRARAYCERVLELGDELPVAAFLFMQIAGALERRGGTLSALNAAMREQLRANLGPELAAHFEALSAALPSVEGLVRLHNRLEAATNSQDVAGDVQGIVVAAHRLLLASNGALSPRDAAVTIELLAERAIEPAGTAPPSLEPAWPLEFVVRLSQAGVAVLMVALDTEGDLIAVVAEGGQARLERVSAAGRSFRSRVHAWNATYPYRYGLIERDEGANEFYRTMEEFKVPMPAADRVIVVAEPLLQLLPFNLVLDAGELAGRRKAIGMAPSLTWLRGAHDAPFESDGRRVAWISSSPESESYGTLEMIFARLEPVFASHAVQPQSAGRLPANLRGAEMVVVAAHGQLTAEGRYIHRIADEQDLIESPAALARSLAGTGLVILFVCSGGRIDQHPFANTGVSLPKLLLDRGCRAVVASPWPLSAAVVGHWLERFMQSWDAGATVMDAAFDANRLVADRLGPEPQYAIAMTVYGDVLLCRRSLGAV